MHETARRGLTKLLRGIAVLAALVVLLVVALRSCKTEEERLSELLDDAREALDDHDRDGVLVFVAPDLTYRGNGDRKSFEAALDRWIEMRALRAGIVERTIEIAPDGNRAHIRLVADITAILQQVDRVTADIDVEKRDGAWVAVRFEYR